MHQSDNPTFKLIVAGDGGVGKEKLIQRFAETMFDTDTRITIGVEFYKQQVNIEGIGPVQVQIWYFRVEERFRFLLPTYVKGANGVMFVFSLTNMLTLSHFDDWLPILRNYDPQIPIMLVGSKLDLKKMRRVQTHEAIEIARTRGCKGYVEVSAKDGTNVNSAFETTVKLMWEYAQKKKQ